MMTRQHFREIAQRLCNAKPATPDTYDIEGHARVEGWRNAVFAVSRALAEFNPRFERRRFFDACGLDG